MNTVNIVHKNIHVKGRVQGVGFRFACKKMAISLGIKGFVKNNYDGSVYIEAEGNELQVFHFIEWCQKGPQYANIEEVFVKEGDLKDFSHFEITF
jgi:acylphosphatase